MKRALYLICILAIISCKKATKSITDSQIISSDNSVKTINQNDGLTILKGDFIYYADAAVLQTPTEVYGVVIDEKMKELNTQVQKYKNQATDMVPVEIKGKLIPKPDSEEGWPYRIEIKEILAISKPKLEDNNTVTLGKQ
tara:strand:+ start:8877 stop:9296 length:420 start_codon:yes stop_codon:yes gene_type:complete